MIMENFMPLDIQNYEVAACAALLVTAILLIAASLRQRATLKRHADSNRFDSAADGEPQPPVSVVVQTFNCNASFLEYCLPAIMEQDYPDFEVIAVNTGESEEISDALTRLSIRYPQLRTTFIPDSSSNVSKKKLAITLGIKAASNDIAVITSACCRPESDRWLKAMARHFNDRTDIVLGTTRHDYPEDYSFGHRYRAFDEVTESARFLRSAIKGRTFRGNGNNIAYRKQLFFDNKGFSSTLNLKYGDDDIFVSEIARRGHVAVELSQESILTEHCADFPLRFRLDKEHRSFTMRQIKKQPKAAQFLQTAGYYTLLLLAAALLCHSVFLFIGGEWAKAAIIAAAAILPSIAEAIVHVLSLRKTATVLHAPRLFFSIPLFRAVQPIVNATFRARASHAGNFTWE